MMEYRWIPAAQVKEGDIVEWGQDNPRKVLHWEDQGQVLLLGIANDVWEQGDGWPYYRMRKDWYLKVGRETWEDAP